MPWSSIIGHQSQIEVLRRAIRQERLPNAYLFTGLKGIGKEAVAMEFAKALNCESQPHLAHGDSCGVCQSCLDTASLQHPNVEWIFPSEKIVYEKRTEGSAKERDAALEQLHRLKEEKIANPYFTMRMERATGILVSQIEYLQEKALYRPGRNRKRVVIISQAEELNRPQAAAANKLLKLLEEPPPFLHFILVSAHPEQLLPTIISRCQPLRFNALSTEAIMTYLTAKGYDHGQARFAAGFSRGNMAVALSIVSSPGVEAIRNRALDFLRFILSGKKQYGFISIAEEMARRDKSREEQSLFLLSLLYFFDDAVRINANGGNGGLINADQEEALRRFAQHFAQSDFLSASAKIEDTLRALQRNANPLLLFLSLGIALREDLIASA